MKNRTSFKNCGMYLARMCYHFSCIKFNRLTFHKNSCVNDGNIEPSDCKPQCRIHRTRRKTKNYVKCFIILKNFILLDRYVATLSVLSGNRYHNSLTECSVIIRSCIKERSIMYTQLHCKNTWVTLTTFLGCPSCISVTKECCQVGFLN